MKSIDSKNNTSDVSLSLNGIKGKDWTLYFNHQLGLLNTESIPSTVVIEHLAGDFFKLGPSDSYIENEDGLTIDYTLNVVIQRQSDAPSGLYYTINNGEALIIQDYSVEGINENVLQALRMPTAASRYESNKAVSMIDFDKLIPIIPQPNHLVYGNGNYILAKNVSINSAPGLDKESEFLSDLLNDINVTSSANNSDKAEINLDIQPGKSPEAYELIVDENGIRIMASDSKGIFYGIQSLRGLMDPSYFASKKNEITVRHVNIKDEPRFEYRGVHLDVARNFHSKETVLKVLELMSHYKLNKFHFHITDDEGWRLEIPGLEELTDVGSKRGHTTDELNNMYPYYGSGPSVDSAPGSGYYSRADFIEIIQFARDHHIEVIPEIDVPSHARAAIKSMEARYHRYMKLEDEVEAKKYLLNDFEDKSEYSSAQNFKDNIVCVCQESTYDFVEKVIDEVVLIFEEAEVPLHVMHSGGDELPYGPWQKSPICDQFIKDQEDVESFLDLHAYFMKRFKVMLDKHKIETAGWEEIVLEHSADAHEGTVLNESLIGQNYRPYVWNAVWGWGREDMAYKLANAGYPIVFCNSAMLYMDMAYNRDPNETGLSWSGWTDTRTSFSVIPLDIFANAKYDKAGNPLKQEDIDNKVRLTDEGRKNFLGIQGQLWCETIKDSQKLEYMMFPKLLAIAERAWSKEPAWSDGNEKLEAEDWNQFANTLGQRELPKLNNKFGGINFRIPLPGAKLEDKMLHANVRFPGLDIRYTSDGSEPTKTSALYKSPIKVSGSTIKLRAFDNIGRSSRTLTIE